MYTRLTTKEVVKGFRRTCDILRYKATSFRTRSLKLSPERIHIEPVVEIVDSFSLFSLKPLIILSGSKSHGDKRIKTINLSHQILTSSKITDPFMIEGDNTTVKKVIISVRKEESKSLGDTFGTSSPLRNRTEGVLPLVAKSCLSCNLLNSDNTSIGR